MEELASPLRVVALERPPESRDVRRAESHLPRPMQHMHALADMRPHSFERLVRFLDAINPSALPSALSLAEAVSNRTGRKFDTVQDYRDQPNRRFVLLQRLGLSTNGDS
jgi:hypothetical protein